jgi:hypothetical protein
MQIALFKRWPKVRPRFKKPELIPDCRADKYPALAPDLEAVATVVYPAFREYDLGALRAQNSFWRQQVALITVTALTAGFGAVQAAISHQIWPGIVVSVLGVLAAAVAGLGGELGTQRMYLEQRSKAERLRALAFTYLAELPPFGGADKRLKLVTAVTAIREGRDPT